MAIHATGPEIRGGRPDAPYFPCIRENPFEPPEFVTQARERPGLQRVSIWDGTQAWLVTRYGEVQSVLRDPRFSSDILRAGYPATGPGVVETQAGLIARLDGEKHAKVRRMLMPHFSAPAIAQRKAEIDSIVDQCIERLLAATPPVDFHANFSFAVPTAVICAVLGVPYRDRAIFQRAADCCASASASAEDTIAAVRVANSYMLEYLDRVSKQQANPTIVSRLVHDHLLKGDISREALAQLAWFLVVAGHETTANMITLSTLAFLLNPDQLETLRRGANLDNAVEEQMRYWSQPQLEPRRVAIEDVEIGGQIIRAGEAVIVSIPAANHDPRQFTSEHPDRFNIGREPRRQISFGYGAHVCLGLHLAKSELRSVYERLYERIPTLRLAAEPDQLKFHSPEQNQYGLYELPVSW